MKPKTPLTNANNLKKLLKVKFSFFLEGWRVWRAIDIKNVSSVWVECIYLKKWILNNFKNLISYCYRFYFKHNSNQKNPRNKQKKKKLILKLQPKMKKHREKRMRPSLRIVTRWATNQRPRRRRRMMVKKLSVRLQRNCLRLNQMCQNQVPCM